MAARKTAPRKKKRKAPRSKLPSFRLPRLSELDQSRRDAIGLGLAGLSLLFAFVFYFGWDGGRVGHILAEALRFFFGAVAYLTPLVLFGAAAALILQRGDGEEQHHRRLGVVVLGCALTLGYAAGTLGLGPPLPHGTRRLFDPDLFMDRGGLVGETLYWAISSLFSRAGAHLVFVFAFAAGLMLTIGVSISTLLHHGRKLVTNGAAGLRERFLHERDRARDDAARSAWYDEPAGEPEIHALHEQDAAPSQSSFAAEEDALEADEPDPLEVVERDVERSEQAGEPAQPDEPTEELELTPMGNRRSAVTESDELDYRLPEASLLKRSSGNQSPDASNQEQVAKLLVETLGHFGIQAQVVGRVTGPRVTRHELRLAPGTKVSKVTQLKDDLAYALASTDIRILAPIPGKQAVGVEVPNKRHRMVYLGDIFSRELQAAGSGKSAAANSSPLSVWLGKDIAGNSVWTDLARMPHVLVAGTTGSGKSGCVNTMLSSILLRASPNEVRMVLVDPKRVELNHYEDIPHLLTPVVTVPRMAANVLANLIREMESRYEVMQHARARNIIELNKTRVAAKEAPLPYILCVIDELADLMMVAPAEVEDSIIRLAQKSRAVGIHLVLATQRPSVDIITGTIKVNVPARIAFAVSSQHDSRVILDQGGAETLLGQGDMLFRPVGSSKLQRIQGAYITEDEIARVTDRWRAQGEPAYDQELLEGREAIEESDGDLSPDEDDLLEEAIHLVAQTQTASVSMVQRRLRVGYTRAGRLIDMLERRGVISGYEGSKPRQVLITQGDVARVLSAGEPSPDPEPDGVEA